MHAKKPAHGSPADRGSADRYYGQRKPTPHYYEGSRRIDAEFMTPEQIAEYEDAFWAEQDRKQWSEA